MRKPHRLSTEVSRGMRSLALIGVLVAVQSVSAENWPRFRGPGGAGTSAQTGLPVQWTKDDYAWKTALPGLGHSSPCVWGTHVFLTSAEDAGRKRLLLDIDAVSGRIRWQREIAGKTHAKHALNSYASATPASDGQRVYVLFASDERLRVLAYDFDGRRIWESDLGPFHQREAQVHGCGTSPIVYRDTVIVANQQDGPSSIIALDSATGKPRWKTPRTLRLTAHSTPFVMRDAGRSGDRLFISNTGDGVASLHPGTGAVISRADLLTARCVGSPVRGGDFVLATCGGGGRGKFLAAVPVDAEGDLAQTQLGWTRDRILPYVPTPVTHGKLLFLWGDSGTVACLQAQTGQDVWTARVGGNYSGSPICVDGKIYCVAQDGTVAVIAAGSTFKVLGKSRLGEGCHSTPAVAGGRMFIRGFQHLFCLQAQTSAK